MDVEVGDVDQRACTGDLPDWSEVKTLVESAHPPLQLCRRRCGGELISSPSLCRSGLVRSKCGQRRRKRAFGRRH